MSSTNNKVKHTRSFAAWYKAKEIDQFYEIGATLFFESPYDDSYDGNSNEESDIVLDRIVDRFGRTILSF